MNCSLSAAGKKIERWHLLGLKDLVYFADKWETIADGLDLHRQSFLLYRGYYRKRAQQSCGDDRSECLYSVLRMWVEDPAWKHYRTVEDLSEILYQLGFEFADLGDAIRQLSLFTKHYYNAEVKMMNV